MNKLARAAAFGGGAALAGGLGALAYPLFFRRRCLAWGARPDEVARKLRGDELLADAGIVSTRAITIDAPPAAVWPWLVQMGSGRGGVYTYDWIENLFGLDMHSTRRILPQFQDVKVGDEFPLGPGRPAMRVVVCDPERTFTIRFADENWVWIFALFAEDGRTRLISRNRIAEPEALPGRLFSMLVMEPGSLVMERKMLLGIKQRAEGLIRGQTVSHDLRQSDATGWSAELASAPAVVAGTAALLAALPPLADLTIRAASGTVMLGLSPERHRQRSQGG